MEPNKKDELVDISYEALIDYANNLEEIAKFSQPRLLNLAYIFSEAKELGKDEEEPPAVKIIKKFTSGSPDYKDIDELKDSFITRVTSLLRSDRSKAPDPVEKRDECLGNIPSGIDIHSK